MTKTIKILRAWDKRNPDTSKDYGIHCCELRFILHGDLGAISFTAFTGWYLPENVDELRYSSLNRPTGADISYHAPTPQYIDQQSSKCDILPAGECYCDGSCLAANDLLKDLIKHGSDYVWMKLEERYIEQFGKLQ